MDFKSPKEIVIPTERSVVKGPAVSLPGTHTASSARTYSKQNDGLLAPLRVIRRSTPERILLFFPGAEQLSRAQNENGQQGEIQSSRHSVPFCGLIARKDRRSSPQAVLSGEPGHQAKWIRAGHVRLHPLLPFHPT